MYIPTSIYINNLHYLSVCFFVCLFCLFVCFDLLSNSVEKLVSFSILKLKEQLIFYQHLFQRFIFKSFYV